MENDTVTAARRGRPPGVRTTQDGLTERQAAVLGYIATAIAAQGYPPSMREIGAAVGLRSTSSVAYQLGVLEDRGYLQQDPHKPRTYRLSRDSTPAGRRPEPIGRSVNAPLLGRIAAGTPVTAEQHVTDVLALPRQLVGEGEIFVLEVVGESMIEAAILPGDLVSVRRQPAAESGEIVAAMIDGEATVKRLKLTDGHAWLTPANAAFKPIPADDAVILGKVVAVMRRT